MEVALAVRRDFGQLPVARTVTVGDVDESGHLEAQESRRRRLVEVDAVDGAARNDDVVMLVEVHAAELAAEHALARVYEQHLVRGAVDIQNFLSLRRRNKADADVV